jgi:hypothetical protein
LINRYFSAGRKFRKQKNKKQKNAQLPR